jgi:hypothetical protein
VSISHRERDNHLTQLDQSNAIDEYMRSKYTNAELYQWMSVQLMGLHSAAHRMALDMARRAERAAVRELGGSALNVIRNDYWTNPRSGLLAGERLHQDIKRLEVAFLEQGRREFELVKHVSLRRLAPRQLVDFMTTGSCEFDVPEWLFDIDAPGQYMRRIKTVSVSVPCVTGPYTGINCKLTLLRSDVRVSNALPYAIPEAEMDTSARNFRRYGATESIVTSSGHDDSGLFETQLRDERFLPFESAGAVSRWRLEIPRDFPQFDHDTISDVLLHIRYTAREGGEELRREALRSVRQSLAAQPLGVLISCRTDFAAEWAQAVGANPVSLRVNLSRSLLPYWVDTAALPLRGVSSCDLPLPAGGDAVFSSIQNAGFRELDLGVVATGVEDKLLLMTLG